MINLEEQSVHADYFSPYRPLKEGKFEHTLVFHAIESCFFQPYFLSMRICLNSI